MRCYYHPNQEAVGLCKACQRGLCDACAADLDEALACKGRHEQLVRESLTANQGNAVFAASFRRNRILGPGFIVIVGVIYAGWSYLADGGRSFSFWLGLLFVLFGAIMLIVNVRAARQIVRKDRKGE